VLEDRTYLEAIPEEQQRTEADADAALYYRLCKAGIGGTGNLLLKYFLPPKEWLSDDEQKAEYAMALMTYDSRALLSESAQEERNINTAWNAIVTNEIPKIYISTAYFTEADIEADGILTEETMDMLMADRRELRATLEEQYKNGEISQDAYEKLLPKLPETPEERRQMAMEDYLQYAQDYRQQILEPYFAKLGNCAFRNLPGDHLIYEEKPDECGTIIRDFLAALD